MKRISLLLMAIAFPLFGEEFAPRTWTTVNGNQVEGAFVKEEDGKIYIKLPNKTVAVGRAKLSPNDLKWVDEKLGKKSAAVSGKSFSFEKPTQLEVTRMLNYRRIKRLIIKTYTKLTNNNRDDKALAFLMRDASKDWGWLAVTSECYPDGKGGKGKVKRMNFTFAGDIPLREAVQMTQDKFVLALPYPITVKETAFEGERYFEVENPPDYTSRILLKVTEGLAPTADPTIEAFTFLFPEAK